MRSAEEWAKECNHIQMMGGVPEGAMCADCARAYARECVERTIDNAIVQVEEAMLRWRAGAPPYHWDEHVKKALRALPGETP